MSIKWHLMIICLLLVIVPVLAVSIVSYGSIKKEISAQVEDNLSQQSLFISGYIEQEYEIIEKGLKNTLDITKSLFLDRGSFYLDTKQKMDVPAVNQVTNEETRISIPTMRFGEDTVYNNT